MAAGAVKELSPSFWWQWPTSSARCFAWPTKRLAEALDSSQRGIEHWQKIIDGGFDRLLSNATKVKEGGVSSSVRNRKPTKKDAPKRGKARRTSTAQPKAGGEEE